MEGRRVVVIPPKADMKPKWCFHEGDRRLIKLYSPGTDKARLFRARCSLDLTGPVYFTCRFCKNGSPVTLRMDMDSLEFTKVPSEYEHTPGCMPQDEETILRFIDERVHKPPTEIQCSHQFKGENDQYLVIASDEDPPLVDVYKTTSKGLGRRRYKCLQCGVGSVNVSKLSKDLRCVIVKLPKRFHCSGMDPETAERVTGSILELSPADRQITGNKKRRSKRISTAPRLIVGPVVQDGITDFVQSSETMSMSGSSVASTSENKLKQRRVELIPQISNFEPIREDVGFPHTVKVQLKQIAMLNLSDSDNASAQRLYKRKKDQIICLFCDSRDRPVPAYIDPDGTISAPLSIEHLVECISTVTVEYSQELLSECRFDGSKFIVDNRDYENDDEEYFCRSCRENGKDTEATIIKVPRLLSKHCMDCSTVPLTSGSDDSSFEILNGKLFYQGRMYTSRGSKTKFNCDNCEANGEVVQVELSKVVQYPLSAYHHSNCQPLVSSLQLHFSTTPM